MNEYKTNSQDYRILVADDLDFIRNCTKLILNKKGYTNVTTVEDGQKALDELAKDTHYDLAILDHKMPYKTGIEVIQDYHRLPNANGTKFINITGSGSQCQIKPYKMMNIPVVHKPYNMDVFLDTIKKQLKKT